MLGVKRALRSAVKGVLRRRRRRAPTYTEEELLRRAEEFNRSAETHWQSIDADPAGRSHVLNKPVSTVSDTPDIFYRLGLLLAELKVGVGHTVLDFGAGSCWLSSCLNRLRCRTVSIDVSPTALKLGKELFSLDQRHRLDLAPAFLPYDGHRIPLPDQSVDRAVCFDAFHHVPNQDEVLSELFRVLKPGGRAVFAEPGEEHSHMDQSLYETERCGVLENDLDLADLIPRARRFGFDEVYVKPYPDVSLRFDAARYLRFMSGSDGLFPVDEVRDSLRHFAVFTLIKGEEVHDSRAPGKLRARIELRDPAGPRRGAPGAPLEVALRVKNTGDTTWLHERDSLGGYVTLGGHLLDETGHEMRRGFFRTLLPRPVAPGETVELTARLPMPLRHGRYGVRLDLVDEWIAWFEQHGSETPTIDVEVEGELDSRQATGLSGALEREGGAGRVECVPGGRVRVRVRAFNTGDARWLHSTGGAQGAVKLGGRLVGDEGVTPLPERAVLSEPVASGDSVSLLFDAAVPERPGRYTLELDLVSEGVCWFADEGGSRLDVPVEVVDVAPDSDRPGTLRARIEGGDDAPLTVTAGGRSRLVLRVTNTGNTRWLHEPQPAAGQVVVGGHLTDAEGRMLDYDFLRAPLPRPVAPGDSVEVQVDLPAPAAPGRYRVVLDLVDEGIAWFGSWGSPVLELDLRVTA